MRKQCAIYRRQKILNCGRQEMLRIKEKGFRIYSFDGNGLQEDNHIRISNVLSVDINSKRCLWKYAYVFVVIR